MIDIVYNGHRDVITARDTFSQPEICTQQTSCKEHRSLL